MRKVIANTVGNFESLGRGLKIEWLCMIIFALVHALLISAVVQQLAG
ncbi:MAG: hypothetical protein K1X83_10220 [Oligoflexia bacterium]|nr:hypothetical protein [Oligoflexia bacterium]